MTWRLEMRSWWTSSWLILPAGSHLCPSLGKGCPSAPPWGVVHGRCPHVTAPRHKANWVHWRCRQVSFPMDSSIEEPWPDKGSPIQLTDPNFYPLSSPPLPIPTRKQMSWQVLSLPQALWPFREDSSAWEMTGKLELMQ